MRLAELTGRAEVRPIGDQEFALLGGLIQRETGIHLPETKKALLARRLAGRVRALGLTSFAAYYRRVCREGDGEERLAMLDAITTHETHFFREPRQFELLERRLLPAWDEAARERRRPRRVRAWSAGCSTGEEPFSLAMVLAHHLPPAAGWDLEVMATDLSRLALAQAQAATWSLERAEEVPSHYRERFMLRGVRGQSGRMRAAPELRALVRFARLNLNDPIYPVGGPFDLILCRNVLIYFEPASKARVVGRLLHHLAPGGYLMVGHAESLNGLTDRVRSVQPTVYTLA